MIDRLGEVIGSPLKFIQGNIRNRAALYKAFAKPMNAVIRFSWGNSSTYFVSNIPSVL